MRRTSSLVAVLVLIGVLTLTTAEPLGAARRGVLRTPDATFYSPQVSPDGAHVLWESLQRDGSVWLSEPDGSDLTMLVVGHSPSWENNGRSFRFVVSKDDGHQVLWNDLYTYDLASGVIKMVAVNSGNPDYQTTLTGGWSGDRSERQSGALAGKTICVDPGHGNNSGAHSPITGKKEDYYVLIMSYLARDYFELAGATVRMTRFDNSILPGLQERVNFSNACGAQSFNAVHLNFSDNTSARGLELYYRTKDAVSQAQARKLHDAMVAATGVPSRGVRPDKETLGWTLAVLSDTHHMHNKTLSEACFLTNPDDVAMLERTRCLDEWAWGIYAGTSRQLGVEPLPLTTGPVAATIDSFSAARPWIGGDAVVTAMDTPEGDHSAGVFKNAGTAFTSLRTGSSTWADYRVTATMSALDAGATYGLVARSNKCAHEGDLLEGYLLVVDEAAKTASLKLSLGKPSEATVLATAPLHDSPRAWRALALECRGKKLTATVDGTALEWSAADAAPLLLEGKAGVLLQSATAARAAIDRFAIEP